MASLVAGPTTATSYNNNINNNNDNLSNRYNNNNNNKNPANRYNNNNRPSVSNNNGAIFNGPGTPAPTFSTNTVATNMKGKENYDPFYPNYKGFGRKASALQR